MLSWAQRTAGGDAMAMQRLLVEEVQRSIAAKELAQRAAREAARSLGAARLLGLRAAQRRAVVGRALWRWSRTVGVARAESVLFGALADVRGIGALRLEELRTEATEAAEMHATQLQEVQREAASSARREYGERSRREAAESAQRRALREMSYLVRRGLDRLLASLLALRVSHALTQWRVHARCLLTVLQTSTASAQQAMSVPSRAWWNVFASSSSATHAHAHRPHTTHPLVAFLKGRRREERRRLLMRWREMVLLLRLEAACDVRLSAARAAASQQVRAEAQRWERRIEREVMARASALEADAAHLKSERFKLKQDRSVLESQAASRRRSAAEREAHIVAIEVREAELEDQLRSLAVGKVMSVRSARELTTLSGALHAWLASARSMHAAMEGAWAVGREREEVARLRQRLRTVEAKPIALVNDSKAVRAHAEDLEEQLRSALRDRASLQHQVAGFSAHQQLARAKEERHSKDRIRLRCRRLAACYRALSGLCTLHALREWASAVAFADWVEPRVAMQMVEEVEASVVAAAEAEAAAVAAEAVAATAAGEVAAEARRTEAQVALVEAAERRGYTRALEAALTAVRHPGGHQHEASDFGMEVERLHARMRSQQLAATVLPWFHFRVQRAWERWRTAASFLENKTERKGAKVKLALSPSPSRQNGPVATPSPIQLAQSNSHEMQNASVQEPQRSLIVEQTAEAALRAVIRNAGLGRAIAIRAFMLRALVARALCQWACAAVVAQQRARLFLSNQQLRAVGALAETRGAKVRAVADRELQAKLAEEAHERELEQARREVAAAIQREANERSRREAGVAAHRKALREAGEGTRRAIEKISASTNILIAWQTSAVPSPANVAGLLSSKCCSLKLKLKVCFG